MIPRIFCWLLMSLLFFSRSPALAAIGCTLTNPAQDLKFVFPEMTSYKEEVYEFARLPDGKQRYASLEARVGSALDPVYEAFETPFTVYSVFQGSDLIGMVHGVNVPGKGGVIQIFVSVDPQSRTIRDTFFQRLESPAAKSLRNKGFLRQFASLSLADWYMHDYYSEADPSQKIDKVSQINPPSDLSEAGVQDYKATMRGVRKNLVLLDIFVFQDASTPYFVRAQEQLKKIARKD